MATTKNIQMQYFNGTDYDTLYPQINIENVNELSDTIESINNTISENFDSLSNSKLSIEKIGTYSIQMTINENNKYNTITLNTSSYTQNGFKFLFLAFENIQIKFNNSAGFLLSSMENYLLLNGTSLREAFCLFYIMGRRKETINVPNFSILIYPISTSWETSANYFLQYSLTTRGTGLNDISVYEFRNNSNITFSYANNSGHGQSYISGNLSLYITR